MRLPSPRLALPLFGLCLTFAGCGFASVRSTQDWTHIEDPRFFRTCHVTNYGSGVCIARREDALFILANSHVVGRSETVTVYVPNENTRRYDRFEATVIASAHVDKVDLALLRVDDPPAGETYELRLARPLAAGEVRDPVHLVVLTAPERPILYTGQARRTRRGLGRSARRLGREGLPQTDGLRVRRDPRGEQRQSGVRGRSADRAERDLPLSGRAARAEERRCGWQGS